MPSFVSIPVTPRTLFKKPEGGRIRHPSGVRGLMGENRKMSKIRSSHFVKRLINATLNSSNLQTFVFFYPKCRSTSSLKRHFPKNSPWIFLKFLMKTLYLCWERYWKFHVNICHRFRAIKKILWAGRDKICPTSPCGARVNWKFIHHMVIIGVINDGW